MAVSLHYKGKELRQWNKSNYIRTSIPSYKPPLLLNWTLTGFLLAQTNINYKNEFIPLCQQKEFIKSFHLLYKSQFWPKNVFMTLPIGKRCCSRPNTCRFACPETGLCCFNLKKSWRTEQSCTSDNTEKVYAKQYLFKSWLCQESHLCHHTHCKGQECCSPGHITPHLKPLDNSSYSCSL